MPSTFRISIVLFLFFFSFQSIGQDEKHSKWSFTASKTNLKIGESTDLIFTVEIDEGWYVYSSDFDPNVGPQVTTFTFKPDPNIEVIGKIVPVSPKRKFDETFGGEVSLFTKKGEFRQKVKLKGPVTEITGTIEYQECTAEKCIPHEIEFSFKGFKIVGSGKTENKSDDSSKTSIINPVPSDSLAKKSEEVSKKGIQGIAIEFSDEVAAFNKKMIGAEDATNFSTLIIFMIAAFIAGTLALFTPCVYPMIPMTVSFFSNTSSSRKAAVTKAIIYGLSIIAIYTGLGLLTSIIFGPDALNYASTHWITNLIFFTVFVVFALSFFGLFEITLPSGLVNSIDKQADKGGFYGVFFMAFTIVVVSFSCTGPIVASILLEASQGELLKPAIGMFGFSMAFALPFTLFAIFPNWLQGLPKSGGWLNAVKVSLGFIELALAFKFLSVADQVYHWGILDRDVFIVLWIAIFTLMAIYLLGKFRLPHDSEVLQIGIVRMLFSLVTVSFVIYLIPGLFGAPLKGVSGILPPISTHDFNLVSKSDHVETRQLPQGCEAPKYGDLLEIPHGIKGYFDYSQALRCARQTGKPVFIDFTGHGCSNCREMEANVWADPKVLKRLKEDFVVVALYVDERKELPKEDWYVSRYDQKLKKTLGKKNFDIEKEFFLSNAQPYYCLVDHSGKLLIKPYEYKRSIEDFLFFLNQGTNEFKKRSLD